MDGLLSTGPTPSSFHIMKLLKHFVPHGPRRKVWLNAQFMGRIEGSQTRVGVCIISISGGVTRGRVCYQDG